MQPKITQADFEARIQKVSEIDWARLAAYVDGEGTIMIAYHKIYGKHGVRPDYVLTLIVANTDLRLIRWLCETFGGSFYFSHPKSRQKVSNRVCHSFRLFEKRAAVVLARIMPYLICKREQAEVGLAYRVLRDLGSKGRKLTPEDLKARAGFREQMQNLNSSQSCDDRYLSCHDKSIH
jgi:hypothetical protein